MNRRESEWFFKAAWGGSVLTDHLTQLPGFGGLFSLGLFLGLIFFSFFFFFFFLRNLSFACPTYCIPQSELEAFFSLIQISLSLSLSLSFPLSISRSYRLPSQPSVHAHSIPLSVFPPRHISLLSSQLSQHFHPCSLLWSSPFWFLSHVCTAPLIAFVAPFSPAFMVYLSFCLVGLTSH